MAQYYQIVGQGPSLTIEELQRYCPNICLDGIIVNQEEQQFGQQSVVVQHADSHNDIIVSEGGQSKIILGDNIQYQQPYVIRHDQQSQMSAVQQAQPPPEFRQQQQQQQQPQQQQRQPMHQHQVYYTSDLPVDAQVVLQQAQQIIDASMMQQQQQPQRQQHMVTPNHVVPQPTVIHPAQQPPPQPPPLQQTQHVTAQPVQQQSQHLNRASQSPHLIQQLQQQQHQIQIHQQLQQQQQLHSQHQTQPMQHQQVVMQTTYVNQVGTPTRAPPASKLLNQSLNSSGVSLVRTPGKTVRPRSRAVRAQARPLNPQLSGNPGLVNNCRNPRVQSPHLLNKHQAPRTPRPRTPLQQQQQPQQMQQLLQSQQHPSQQQQLTSQQPSQLMHTQLHQQLQSQQMQLQQQIPQQQQQQTTQIMPQRLHSPQLEHLKLAQHQQRILNQQHNQAHAQARGVSSPVQNTPPTRIITPQGLIVQQPNQLQQPAQGNSQLPQQNSQMLISQRSSPALPTRKVVVQPNNASDMDDLEDSITAAVLQKNPTDTARYTNTSPPLIQTSSSQYPYSQQQMQYQSQSVGYEHTPHQFNQMMMEESHDEDTQMLTLSNGQRITLAEYKRLHLSPRTLQQTSQQIPSNVRQPILTRKEPQRPVQRVTPMQSHQQLENAEDTVGISEPQATEQQSAKMLIFLQNGEQRLITFTLPKESCTVEEVLEQVNVPYSDDVQCIHNTGSDINYVVTIGARSRMDEIETHPILTGSSQIGSSQSTEQSTPEKSLSSDQNVSSPESERSPPPKYIDGKLAVCKSCGYTGYDFSRCERCRRLFTEEPKSITIASKVEEKKKEPEKPQNANLIEKSLQTPGEIKLNLLKTVKTVKNNVEKKVGRGRKSRKQPDPEPVILTLSSDEEDSNSSTFASQYELSISMKEPSLSEIEGGTPDSGIGIEHDDDSNPPSGMQGVMTSLQCRTIRIGSYRFAPKERIYISSKGIKIVAPSLKDTTKDVALQIHIREVVRILVHFGKGLPVIFLYTMSICGNYIRKSLDMTEETGPYYNPVSKNDAYRRITLLPELISEESKLILKKIFGKILEELSTREANEILVKTCIQENSSTTKIILRSSSTGGGTSGIKSSSTPEIRQILIYPPGKGGISINTEDFMCLAQDQFLNDVIIDFYLKHLLRDVLTPAQREKTHMFSTFFYKRLTTKPSKVNKSGNPQEWDSTLTPAQKRHARVKTWTKNVNIFEKDFVVVPINENCHWFVAIICFPSLEGCRSMLDNRTVMPQEVKRKERRTAIQIGNTTITQIAKPEQLNLSCDSDNISERDEAEAEESDLDMQCDSDEEEIEKPVEKKIEICSHVTSEPIKQPCILICDSLAGASRSRVVATLRDYLTCEYNAKMSTNKKFTKDNIKGICPKVPQQNNFTDCGLYLLQYVEQFFKDPILDYTLPIKQLTNWFDEIVVTRKREEISNLIKMFIQKYNPDSDITLPDIAFPTLNGKLVETEEQDCESDSERFSNDEGTITPSRLTLVKQTASGDIVFKRSITDAADSIHLRKSIRLANSGDSENRSFVQIAPEFIKKGNSEPIIIPIKIHSELVKDIQNTLIHNKNNSVCDKKNNVNSQNVSSVNCFSESDSNTILKSRKLSKFDDSSDEFIKKLKKRDC